MSSQRKSWPMEPLERLLVQYGGKTVGELARARGVPENQVLSLVEAYRVGLREGGLTLLAMDAICVDVFGVHPIEVYGPEVYFDPSRDTARPIKPCQKCQGPKELGDTHMCRKCVAEAAKCACGCGELKQGQDIFKLKFARTCKRPRRKARPSEKREAAAA